MLKKIVKQFVFLKSQKHSLVKLPISGWMRLLRGSWNAKGNSQQRQNDEHRKNVAQIASGCRRCGNGTSLEAGRRFETSSTSCPTTSRYNWLGRSKYTCHSRVGVGSTKCHIIFFFYILWFISFWGLKVIFETAGLGFQLFSFTPNFIKVQILTVFKSSSLKGVKCQKKRGGVVKVQKVSRFIWITP